MTAVSARRDRVGDTRRSDRGVTLCWAVFILWFAVSLWSFLAPGSGGPPLLAQLLLLLFVAMHGSLSYGWRGTAAYMVIAGTVSMLLEITSVHFGFPFGFYTHHTPGQLLGVPLIIPLVYATLGWAPWAAEQSGIEYSRLLAHALPRDGDPCAAVHHRRSWRAGGHRQRGKADFPDLGHL